MKTTALILALSASAAAAAQPGAMTMDDCMRYAIEHNFDVATSRLSADDDLRDFRKAKASFFPSVGGSISAQYSFGRSIDPGTNTYDNLRTFNNSYSMSLSWTIFDGGQLVNDFRQAKAQKRLSETALQWQRDEVAIAVMDAFVNRAYYNELQKIMVAKLEESREALTQTRRMKELGLKSAVDLGQAEAQYADDDYNLTNTTSLLRSANLNLKNAMNFPVSDSLALSDPDFSISCPLTLPGAEEVMAFAAANNPVMRQAAISVDISRYALRSARGTFSPTISLNAGLSSYYYKHIGAENMPFKDQMDVNFGQYVGLSMSIPIFDGLARATAAKKARISHIASQVDYNRKLYELRSSVEQAVLDRDNYAKESVKLERKQEADSIAYAQAKRKYGEGLMSFLDMQKLANTWFASQAELLRSRLLFDVKRRLVDYYLTNDLFSE